jgi:putative SOS response-associated peptidase YedK
MCGRFTLHTEREILARRFRVDLDAIDELKPRYNIAPAQSILAVYTGESGRVAARMRWGLIPSWAKDPQKLPSMINARVETAATRASYRVPFRRQRCLIVADGFYEWGPTGERRGARTPYWFGLPSGDPFAMAGLWSAWRPPDEQEAEPQLTCTILTTSANSTVARVHDRMPVILEPEAEEAWLDPELRDVGALGKLLPSLAADSLRAVPVSRRVNSPRNDGPELIQPVPEPPSMGF